MAKLKVSLGFTTDTAQAKRQIDDLAQSLKKITENSASILDDTDLKAGVQAAKDLEKHLQKAFNVDTGKIDLSKFSRSLDSSGQSLKSLQKNLSKLGADGDQAFLNLSKSIISAEAPTLRLNSHVKNLLDDLIKVSRWQLSSSIMHGFMGAVQTAYGYSQDLNKSLTNIGIVTGRNAEQMANFADKANTAAKALSTTTVDYADAALIYYQQGLPEEQIEERTAITIKMANAVGQSVETVSDQLTAIWNNYYDGSKSLQYYADVLMRLGADTASSSDEISEGLGKFSAVADTIGLSYEYAASALATITATTRESANTVGTALKTLFSRIQGLKLGETLEDGTDLNKYSEALAKVGVDIKDANGGLKDMDNILNEVGAKWKVLGKDQQMALAQTVAGVRQYNQFVALMDNWGYFQELLTSSINSTGALEEQAEIFEESWQASLNRVRASAEGVYNALINDDFFIGVNDTFAGILTGIEGVVEGLGGMGGILTSASSIFLSLYAKEIPDAIDNTIDNLKVMVGLNTKSMAKTQQELKTALQGKEFLSNTKSLEMERLGLIKISEARQQLITQSGHMSAAEQKEAQEKIKAAIATNEKVVALQKEAEAQQLILDNQIKTSNTSLINEYIGMGQALNEIPDKIEVITDKLEFLKQAGQENTSEFYDLSLELKQLEQKPLTGLIDDVETLKRVVGLSKEELEKLGEYDYSKGPKQQTQEIINIYKKLEERITGVQNGLKEVIEKQSALKGVSNQLGYQINDWENLESNIEDAKNEAQEFLNALSYINDKYKIGLDFNNGDYLEKLNQALKDPNVSLEALKQSFVEFLRMLETQGAEATNNFEFEIDELKRTLSQLSGNTVEAQTKVEDFTQALMRQADAAYEADVKNQAFIQGLDRLNTKSLPRMGEVIGEVASGLMAVSSLIQSIQGLGQVFSDEDATAGEKFGAVLSFVAMGAYDVIEVSQGLDTVIKKATHGTKNLGSVLTPVGTKLGILKQGASGLVISFGKLFAVLGIGAVVLGTIGGIIAYNNHKFEEGKKHAEEAAEKSKELVKADQERIKTNTDLIKSMQDLMDEENFEQINKSELVSITEELCDKYELQGAAIAELTGKYEDYNKVLQKAKELQKQELEEGLKNAKEAADDILTEATFEAREGKFNYQQNGDYFTSLFNFGIDTNTANIVSKNLREFISNQSTSWAGEELRLSISNIEQNPEKLYELYQKMVQTKNELEEESRRGIISLTNNGYYSGITTWIDQMSESMEDYKENLAIIQDNSLMLKYDDASINTYKEYQVWLKNITNEMNSMGISGERANSILSQVVSSAINPDLAGYYRINKVLTDIQATGTTVSEETLVRLWEAIDAGTSKWDEATLAGLDWKNLTEETWEEAANAAQGYYDAISFTNNIEEIKASAKEAQDIIKDGINNEVLAKLGDVIDWGNAEKGIIEYVDFLRLTAEEQEKYINDLANTTLVEGIDKQIETVKQQIEQYQKELDELNSKDNLDKINAYKKLTSLYNDRQNIGNYFEDNKDFEDFLSSNGFVEMNRTQFQGLSEELFRKKFRADEIEELALDIKIKENSLNNAKAQLDTLTDQREVEMILNPDPALIESYINDLEIIATLSPDDQKYQEAMNRITNADYSVQVAIQAELEDSIQEALDKTNDLTKAASLIGDEYLVAADDLMTLVEVFPDVLQGYTVMSDGMIKLNSDQVNAVLTGAKDEVNANFEVQRQKLEGEKIVAQEKIKVLQNQLSNIETVLSQEVEATQGAELEEVLISLKGTNEKLGHESDLEKASREADGEISESTAKAAEDRAESVRKYVELAMKYMDILKKYENATGADRDKYYDEILSLRNTAINSGYDPTVMNDVAEKYVQSEAYETKKGFDDFRRQFLEDLYKNTTEDGKSGILRQYLEDQMADIEKKLQEQQKVIDSSNSTINALNAQQESAYNKFTNTAAGLGADGKADSSNSSKSESDLREDADIYKYIDFQLEEINQKLQDQKRLIGSLDEGSEQWYQALEDENELLKEQNELYETKKKLALSSLALTIQELKNSGYNFEFDANNNLKNPEAVLQDLIDKRNALDLKDKDAVEKADKEIDTLGDLIDKYYDTIEILRDIHNSIAENGLQIQANEASEAESRLKQSEEKLKELIKQQEEKYNNLEAVLNLKLQIDENALKKLEYYIDKLSDDFYSMAEAGQLILDKIPVVSNSLGNYEQFYNELETAYAAGEITSEDYLKGLQESYDGILDNLSALNELDKEMLHYYEETLKAAKEELGNYTDSLEHLTSVLEHYKNIVELIDGEYNFEAMDTILRGQTQTIANEVKAAENIYQMMLQQKHMAEQAMIGVERGSAAWEVLNNNLEAATKAVEEAEEEMLNKTEEWVKAMKAVMENTFEEIVYNMEMFLTNGLNFDTLNKSMERLSAYQDIYLTETNQIYETSKLMRAAQQAADKTDSVSSKQKLNNYIKEIEGLKNKTKLSKLDLELAQARYDILLAEMALEEAQNSKSTVRLQRDSEGNFGYVYTADTEAISQAEQDLADAQNKLYNIGLDNTNDYGQKMLELQQRLTEDLLQLEQDRANGRFTIEGSYEAARDQLIQEYTELFKAYSKEYTTALEVDTSIQQEAWITAYDSMINKTIDWELYITQATDECEQAYEEWRTGVEMSNQLVQNVLNNTKEKVDNVTTASDQLKDKILNDVIPAVSSELTEVQELTIAYANQRDAIMELMRYYEDLIEKIEAAIDAQARLKMEQLSQEHDISKVKDFSQEMADYLESGGSTSDSWYQALLKGREEKLQQQEYKDKYGGTNAINMQTLMTKYEYYKRQKKTNELTQYVDSINESEGKYFDPKKIAELIATYATGGYTGAWGPSGRLGILHEKELVLNANDTVNFLNAAEILRRVSDSIDLEAMTSSVSLAPFMGMLSNSIADNTLQQQVMIEANFPNVQDRNEIEEAISNLINTASQYANIK